MEENKMIKQTKFGWVDLSNIPRKGKLFNWKDAVGKTIDFQYKDISSMITIDEYCDNKSVYISIDGYVSHYQYDTGSLVKGQIGILLKQIHRGDFMYQIGEIVSDNILIIERYRDDRDGKMYRYKCLTDGYCGVKGEQNLMHGSQCPVCAGQQVLAGYNDIATTYPHLVQYFKNPDDATKYSVGSSKKTWFKCPICGNEKYVSCACAFQNGYSCSRCGDNSSYGNKFVYCFLTQVKNKNSIAIYSEKSFDWSRKLDGGRVKKIYDFHIIKNNKSIIIEVHGEQHFNGSFERYGGRTLQEEQENDLYKYRLALSNGFDDESYITLDCRKSKMDFIKQSIMNSRLPHMLDFIEEDIDWNRCDEYACSSLVKMACDFWNDGIHNASQIARLMGKASCTISNYLRKGHEIGWIEYEPATKTPVMCLENNYVFSYSTICSNYSEELLGVFINKQCIINNLCGDRKSTHGFHFQHITRKEFNRIKETEPWRVFE